MNYRSEITLADFRRLHPDLAEAAGEVVDRVTHRTVNVRGERIYSERLLATAAHTRANSLATPFARDAFFHGGD